MPVELLRQVTVDATERPLVSWSPSPPCNAAMLSDTTRGHLLTELSTHDEVDMNSPTAHSPAGVLSESLDALGYAPAR